MGPQKAVDREFVFIDVLLFFVCFGSCSLFLLLSSFFFFVPPKPPEVFPKPPEAPQSANVAPSCLHIDPSWLHLESSWLHLGSILAHLGSILAPCSSILAPQSLPRLVLAPQRSPEPKIGSILPPSGLHLGSMGTAFCEAILLP